MPTAHIAIGSNLGDRHAQLSSARRELQNLPDSELTAFSSIYETEPVGPAGQGPYLNAAAAIETRLGPRDLLDHLLEIERRAGRQRSEKWGPRTLDLDLLLYDDVMIDEPGLTIPHPRMHERTFVLEPLSEIAPNAVHPALGATIRQLLAVI